MNFYTSLAHIYHDMYQDLFDYDAEFIFYDEWLTKFEARHIIEFGCGTGNLAKRFVAASYKYLGVDLNQEMLEIAKKTIEATYFQQGNVINFRNEKSFDAALITGRTISYLVNDDEVSDALINIHKILKKDGLLIFDLIDAQPLFDTFDTSTKELFTGKYKRISRSIPRSDKRWTWDWESTYYEINDQVESTCIGNDTATLRAFGDEEISEFLKNVGYDILHKIPKTSYTWQGYFLVCQKTSG
ncbi:MAG: class I SAM-dependent methyltransferase [Saprospiraceae bacterium]|nr:class I SAM-dependent methyltransferase [Saprospiraceae bacterium]